MSDPGEIRSGRSLCPAWWAIAVPVVVLVCWCAAAQTRTGSCIDESFYLPAMNQVLKSGRWDVLAEAGTAPLPLYVSCGPVLLLGPPVETGPVWSSFEGDEILLARARWCQIALIGVPMILLTTFWIVRRTGSSWAAFTGGTMIATSPMWQSQLNVATTDAAFALFFVIALMALGRSLANPTVGRFLLAGVTLGLAVASKYSAVLIIPVAYVLSVLCDWHSGVSTIRILIRAMTVQIARAAGLSLLAFLTCWGVCGFQFHETPLTSRGPLLVQTIGKTRSAKRAMEWFVAKKWPSPVAGFANQLAVTASQVDAVEFPARLRERYSSTGHRAYYLMAVVVKSTLVELTVLGAAFAGTLVGVSRLLRQQSVDWPALSLAAGTGVLFLLCSLSAKQFGLRYVLPVYPVAILLGMTAIHRLAARSSWSGVILLLLLAGHLASSAWQCRRPLSYFNEASGGPDQGYRLLGNADVDWGQGVPDLAMFLKANGETQVVNLLSGPDRTSRFGIESIGPVPNPPCRYLAIGTTRLFRGDRTEPFLKPFETMSPDAIVGHSIFVFDVTRTRVAETYSTALLTK